MMTKIDAKTLRRIHIGTDILLVSAAWVGAYWLRVALSGVIGNPPNAFDAYRVALPAIVIPWIATCWWFDIYRSARMSTLVDHIQNLFKGVFLGVVVISAVSFFFFKQFEFSRTVILLLGGLNLVLQGTSRVAFYKISRHLQRNGKSEVPALIIGTGINAIRLLQKLQDHPEEMYFFEESEDGRLWCPADKEPSDENNWVSTESPDGREIHQSYYSRCPKRTLRYCPPPKE